jgi:hypothetical protein
LVDEAESLLDRLEALPPRDERLLREAGLHGRNVEELAGWLGVRPGAATLSLLRAARRFAGLEVAPPDEDARARALAEGRLQDASTSALAELRTQADAIVSLERKRLDARAGRDQTLRWVAAAALVILAWLLSQAH